MHYKVKEILAKYINEFLYEVDSSLDSFNPQDVPLGYPKDKQYGHFSTTISFILAKRLRKSPNNIANDIAKFINQRYIHISDCYSISSLSNSIDHNNHLVFEEVVALNGYLNIKLSLIFFEHEINLKLSSPHDFAKGEEKNHKILLEYVSANPTGPLHIGHARGAVFGSALQRVGKHLGYDIIGEYYVNDAGSQIDMLALSVFNAVASILDLDLVEGEIYRGEYIDDIARAAILHFGEGYFTKDFQSIIIDIGLYAKDLMLNRIKSNLSAADIVFDSFVSEKSLYCKWQDTLDTLKSNGALDIRDGAIWLKSSLKNDEKDRVLVRDSGEPTYMAGDIIYHRDKFDRGFDSYINIWGADHHGYIARIKASIDFLGYDSDKLDILLAQMVNLLKAGKPYKMSKRAGNFILMEDIINDIGSDSLKFIFLSKALGTHLEFDVDVINKQDSSNPLFYINYANARIHTLLKKSDLSKDEILSSSIVDIYKLAKLDNIEELRDELVNLMVSALSFSYILRQSYEEKELHKICEYLKNLAKQLHVFYNSYKILQTPLEAQILKVFMLVSLSLSTGFSLLGIEIKTQM
ncbi:arginine--tRNA ligase [Helicobacter muridarum]|uniref:Arginine--tRNA ligase n=1 Tax=Helicobacter muridarum TaxID=216 RepID=A0A099TZY8_9HELI|nr:arginine--tRNA ligase [Helicobacter muridarum]TLD99265.1 arginine--tRNA ligase [Helicobacter muridarum]STQ86148.1 arginyl-tRNA synthetase [Helicobacter muridarum]